MKSVDVQSNTYIKSSKENNDKDPKFKIADVLRISKYKNVFTKGYTPKEVLKKFLWLKNFKTMYRGHMLLVILNAKKLLKHFTKNNCKKQIKKCLDLKKWYYM